MKFKDFYLQESINDKYLFKAVFMAGGPGSGKSFIGKAMFSGFPVKFINSDDIFEKKLELEKISKILDSENIELYAKQMQLRNRAKELLDKQWNQYINGMLPLIIDGTGREYPKIKKYKEQLDSIGYDTYMVFVNTSLETAIKRNQLRNRQVPMDFLKKAWADVQTNMGKFQSLFGGRNFLIVDQNKNIEQKDIKEFEKKMHRAAMKFLTTKLINRKGVETLNKLKQIKGKYLSDLI